MSGTSIPVAERVAELLLSSQDRLVEANRDIATRAAESGITVRTTRAGELVLSLGFEGSDEPTDFPSDQEYCFAADIVSAEIVEVVAPKLRRCLENDAMASRLYRKYRRARSEARKHDFSVLLFVWMACKAVPELEGPVASQLEEWHRQRVSAN